MMICFMNPFMKTRLLKDRYSNENTSYTSLQSLRRWTKDHPITNVIGDPSRSISTRKQLQTNVMWCYFDAFLTFVEPKNLKQAMTEPSWIDAMQEEIHEFERLQVWELESSNKNMMIFQMDVKMDFLNDELKEEGTINMMYLVSKDTGMSLTAYSDADHAGCQDTRRSTSGSAQFLGDKLVESLLKDAKWLA
ncbi:uncharacterized mitochondrial protein-like protein [Tanacetum coccineum]